MAVSKNIHGNVERNIMDNIFQRFSPQYDIKRQYVNTPDHGTSTPVSTKDYYNWRYADIGGIDGLHANRLQNNPNYLDDADKAFTSLNRNLLRDTVKDRSSFFERLFNQNQVSDDVLDHVVLPMKVANPSRIDNQQLLNQPVQIHSYMSDAESGYYAPSKHHIATSPVNYNNTIAHEFKHALQNANGTTGNSSLYDMNKLYRLGENVDVMNTVDNSHVASDQLPFISQEAKGRLTTASGYHFEPIEIEASLSGDLKQYMKQTGSRGIVTDNDAQQFLDWLDKNASDPDMNLQMQQKPNFLNTMKKYPDKAKQLLQGIVSNKDKQKREQYA